MKRLSLPCPACGGAVSDAPVKCQACGHRWNGINHFYGDSYSYKLAQATVAAHDGAGSSPTEHIYTVLEHMTQAQKYLAALQQTIGRASAEIGAVVDGEPITYRDTGEMAEDVLSLMYRRSNG